MRAGWHRAGRTPEWELALWHLASLRDAAVAGALRAVSRGFATIPRPVRGVLRRLALLAWWSLTLQLPRHLAFWLAARRARAVRPASVPLLARSVPAPQAILLAEPASRPVVSVIIASYGAVPHSLRCLAALAQDRSGVAMEVIVIDDASPDPAVATLALVPGLRLIRNPVRLGYLRSCNAAAATARGEYLLLLNNDTEPAPDAIAAMLALFRTRPDAGAVGAKLVFPDGRLQEAGGIIWRDGSGWNYGRGDDPDLPAYNYVREVDYCSAAALMVPRALFAGLGGFDPRYAPAYYEDTDLAFRLRAAGRPVLYQPRARVMHVEGVSHGTDIAAGGKAHQVANRARFAQRWEATLAAAHYAPGTNLLRARERGHARPVVLVLDHYVPAPDRDAGSRNILNYIDALLADGAIVKFWPHNRAYAAGYTEALQDRGVEVFHGGNSDAFPAWVAAHGAELDLVLLSRPDVAQAALAPLKRHSPARLVYYGTDLHFRRLRQQADVTGDAQAAASAARMERLERWIWRSVDVVLYPSAEEATTVACMEPAVVAKPVPAFGFATFGAERAPPEGADILFVGGFAHPPNEAAVLWFAREILPRVQARHPAARLVIAGSHQGPLVRALAGGSETGGAGNGAALRADLPAAELLALYQAARVVVAPLRFGAGVKLKVAEALREGTPLVTTSVGAQGLPGIERAVAIADDPAGFADAVVALLDDAALWRARCCAQLAYAREHLTEAALRRRFLEAAGLRAPDPAPAAAARAAPEDAMAEPIAA
jgi:GT2 family glycosyltransferase